ncbi:MAG: VanZ family protein [Clostridiaceae bacterium]|nr:VanZ family protein [Clostridiaceae bacterium]
MKKAKKRPSKNLTRFLFILYLIVLTWVILFKMELDFSLLKNMNDRSINLIPFAESVTIDGKTDISEILLNVIVFIPFGIYISMLHKPWNFIQKIIPIFCVSLLYEVLQYAFAIGGSDITDLIGNTLGGIIGMILFFILIRMFGKDIIWTINLVASIGTTVVILFLGLLVYVNM